MNEKIDAAIRHATCEGAADYHGRADDVARGAEPASWAWPFVDADAAYINAIGTAKICRDAGIDESDWVDVCDAWCAAFRRGYEGARPGPKPRGTTTGRRRLELRLTDDERVRWSEAAEREVLTLSEFVRSAVERAIRTG